MGSRGQEGPQTTRLWSQGFMGSQGSKEGFWGHLGLGYLRPEGGLGLGGLKV